MKISKRKDDHIKYALDNEETINDFDLIKIEHNSLPTFNLADVNLKSTYLGYNIDYPIYINAMTGGSDYGMEINKKLALIAKRYNIPLILGSQSAALKNKELEATYKVAREYNKDGIILGNISLNYNYSDALKAVSMIGGNGLSIHLNLIQELVMHEGDREFSHWESNLQEIIKKANFPVVVKEVGFGMSRDTIKKLQSLGVKYIDVSGQGGTNFAKIERKRKDSKNMLFDNIGISTVDSINNAKDIDVEIFASGGIRNAHDIFKALYLGASAVGLSSYFLKLTKLPIKDAFAEIDAMLENLKKLFLIYGYKSIKDL